MALVWPATLPQVPEYGWTETKLDNRVRSDTDSGPAKVRRRFTRAVRRVQITMALTTAQVFALDVFHTTTLADGSLKFEMVHPRTGITYEFRFVGELAWTEQANGFYRTSFELEYQT